MGTLKRFFTLLVAASLFAGCGGADAPSSEGDDLGAAADTAQVASDADGDDTNDAGTLNKADADTSADTSADAGWSVDAGSSSDIGTDVPQDVAAGPSDDASAADTWNKAAARAAFIPTASHESALGDGWLAAGQPSKARLEDTVGQGATVVSLRNKSEEPFAEQAFVESKGGTFVRYAVSTSQYGDKAFRAALWDLYDAWQVKGGLVYLHCASSNRVGASWALYQFERKGLSKQAAYDLGVKAGMTGASSIVKQVLGLAP